MPAYSGLTCDGIDVSSANGPILWSEVRKAGYRFAYVKAAHKGTPDPLLHRHADGLDSQNMLWGPYQWPGLKDAKADVQALAKALKGRAFDLAPALDLETLDGRSGGEVLDYAETWGAEARIEWGKPVMLYHGLNFWRTLLAEMPERAPLFAPWLAWTAAYATTCTPLTVAPWGVTMRQWRGNTIWSDGSYGPKPKTPGATMVVAGGRVPGVATECDLNRYFGCYDDLKRDHGLAVAPLPSASAARPLGVSS